MQMNRVFFDRDLLCVLCMEEVININLIIDTLPSGIVH